MGDAAKKRIEFPSKLDQVVPVQSQIIADVEAAGFGAQAVFAIRLALDEALANAVTVSYTHLTLPTNSEGCRSAVSGSS